MHTLLDTLHPLAAVASKDTVFTKVLLTTKDLTEKAPEGSLSKLLPLIGVLVGGLLTVVGQYIFKRIEMKQSIAKEINTAKNNLIVNINSLPFLLRDLAYLKVDSNLQYYYAENETDKEAKKKALEENYSNYRFIAEKEMLIAKTYAEIYMHLLSYCSLKKITMAEETVTALNELKAGLINMELANTVTDDMVAGNGIHEEIERLTDLYLTKPTKIDTIIKTLCKE